MNTLTPFHLALVDSLGELIDRIEEQADAAVTRIEQTAAEADARTAHDVADFMWQQHMDSYTRGLSLHSRKDS